MIRILAEPRLGLLVSEHASASWLARAEDSALRETDIHEFRKTYAIQLPWLLRLLCWDNFLPNSEDCKVSSRLKRKHPGSTGRSERDPGRIWVSSTPREFL